MTPGRERALCVKMRYLLTSLAASRHPFAAREFARMRQYGPVLTYAQLGIEAHFWQFAGSDLGFDNR
ncbi:hypothetical protein Poly41_07860 [Novipirellula artificiosorum]|uniref:Uncharacterized protein n=1 Tax=Novipirellula artificiosorum TaxID=2528016 RepID=A0A5C6E5T7_9BACT|nr:hypothetical protein Poly41_07860 [Novipirellula artificiosorum]